VVDYTKGEIMLNSTELEILLEAMRLWENETPEEITNASTAAFMGMLTGRSTAENLAEAMFAGAQRQKEMLKPRKEMSILIQAKLLQMRDKLIASEIGSELNVVESKAEL
jgi:methylthioribose-1-phosphate isomerase